MQSECDKSQVLVIIFKLTDQPRSWVSLKGVRRQKMFGAKLRVPKARDARGVRGYAPLENFEHLGAL